MALKRPLDIYDSPISSTPPRTKKQKHNHLSPSSSPSTFSFFATPSTPIRNWSIPFDSPTNPFGRIRRLTTSTTLPRPTSYSKHLPLRFQLIRPPTYPDGRTHSNKHGVYRVVQVPLTYTLSHLRNLLKFVFQPANEKEMGGASYNFRRAVHRASLPLASSSSNKSNSKQQQQQPELDSDSLSDMNLHPGHLFELQESIVISRSGEIKTGKTCIKASNARDPYHYPGNRSQYNLLDPEDDTWQWEAEEDYRLSQLWAPGGDIKKGIIYHHDSTTQIHITLNTKKIPSRKGVGNKPFLFIAFGSVDLFAPPLTKTSIIITGINPARWNGLTAFENFLKAEAEQERLKRGEDEDKDKDKDEYLEEDVEGDLDPDVSSSTLPMCSSIGFSPHSHSHTSSVYSYSYPSSSCSSSSAPAITPFPASPSQKRRVDYANKRMLELTRKVLGSDSGEDDDDDDDEKKKRGEQGDLGPELELELDELGYDDDDDEDPFAVERPSDWDPFGPDEAEIC